MEELGVPNMKVNNGKGGREFWAEGIPWRSHDKWGMNSWKEPEWVCLQDTELEEDENGGSLQRTVQSAFEAKDDTLLLHP